MNFTSSRGFTLIELLVVIAIIGLLSGVILAPIQSARKKARDAQRVSQLTNLRTALLLYFDDNGQYPIATPTVNGWRSQCINWGGYTNSTIIPGLVPNYLPRMPTDALKSNPSPSDGSGTYCYLYLSDGVSYKVLLHNTTETLTPPVGFQDPVRPGASGMWAIGEGAGFTGW